MQRLLAAHLRWLNQARPEQLTPAGTWWSTWLAMAGRGWGKTRVGAEDMARYGIEHAKTRLAIVAPTIADARDTCVEGESGLLSVLRRYGMEEDKGLLWNRSLGELVLFNGTRYKLFSAEKPARLRGPQHHRAWVDELAQVVKNAPDAWDMLQLGLRLGTHPQAIATTTPLPVQVVRDLLAAQGDDVAVSTGSTFDNAANLAPPALKQFRKKYEGTRLGRQELYAELLTDIPGALWQRAWLDADRVQRAPILTRTVVAVDPAVTSGEDADETGIVVAGQGGHDGHGYVLGDYSMRDTPLAWATKVAEVYDRHQANLVVIEVNQGGEALTTLLRQVRPGLPIVAIHAKKGKRVRAEPVSALYEQHRVHHVGTLAHLEDQLCTWTPEQVESPDRMDALVYALLYLFEGSHAAGFLSQLASTHDVA